MPVLNRDRISIQSRKDGKIPVEVNNALYRKHNDLIKS